MKEKTQQTKQERLDAMHKAEKVKKEFMIIGIIILVLVGFYFLVSNSNSQKFTSPNVDASKVPEEPIHWHPELKILFDGIEQNIPANIGINPGKHDSTHTHDSDGKIHLENSNPKSNPDSLALGYFFKVWKKPFNSTCILDKCTDIDGGSLKFSVNGVENFEYEKFVMKENSKMLIEYTSKNR